VAWLIFFIFWIILLWLYKYSERHKQLRLQALQGDTKSDYGHMKNEFDESMALFNSTTDFKERLTHIDKAIEHLKQMESRLPGEKHASEKLPQLMSLKQALIYSDIKEQYEKAMNRAKEATLIITKVKNATAAQTILNEGLSLGMEKKTLAKELEETNNFIHKIQYDEYLNKAKKEEEKGRIKSAIDQYQVALYFLKSGSMENTEDDSTVSDIEEKIQNLYKKGLMPE